jgi:hypothetical protein
MGWITRSLRQPASQSQSGIVLGLCIVTMSIMSVAIVWQAQIISNQREAILWLERIKFSH